MSNTSPGFEILETPQSRYRITLNNVELFSGLAEQLVWTPRRVDERVD